MVRIWNQPYFDASFYRVLIVIRLVIFIMVKWDKTAVSTWIILWYRKDVWNMLGSNEPHIFEYIVYTIKHAYHLFYITVTSKWAQLRLKSPASLLFTQPFIQTQIKENIKAPRHWPLCGEFTGTDEFPTQRASYAENVSIWWRHHDLYLHRWNTEHLPIPVRFASLWCTGMTVHYRRSNPDKCR